MVMHIQGDICIPLRWRSPSRDRIRRELAMAGNRGVDHIALICAAELLGRMMPASARYIGQPDWATLSLGFICASEKRLSHFLRKLAAGILGMRHIARRSDVDCVIVSAAHRPLPDAKSGSVHDDAAAIVPPTAKNISPWRAN